MAEAHTRGAVGSLDEPRALSHPGPDARRRRRWLEALLLPVGPAAIGILRFVLPYKTTDDESAIVRKVIADPGAQSLVLWLALVGVLTLVPALFSIARLTRRRAPRLTAAALLLAVPGYLALGFLLSLDVMLWSGAKAGLDATTLTALTQQVHPASGVAAGVFVLGHVLGTVLLGLALWRSGVVPRWAAVAAIVSQPLHVVAAVAVGSPGLDLVAYGLNAVAFAAAGVALLRVPHEEPRGSSVGGI